jgi:Zn-dependent alcohol dehydrogenase
LTLAKELGATDAVNSLEEKDVAKQIKSIIKRGANFAIDCTGILKVIENMLECIGHKAEQPLLAFLQLVHKSRSVLTFLLENKNSLM